MARQEGEEAEKMDRKLDDPISGMLRPDEDNVEGFDDGIGQLSNL